MPDNVDGREAKIQEVLLILRHRNMMRYGINEVDEPYVRSLTEPMLDHIITRENELRECGY